MVFKRRQLKKLVKEKSEDQPQSDSETKEKQPEDALSIDLQQNISKIQHKFGNSSDLSFTDFEIGGKKAVLIFIDGLVDKMLIYSNLHIIYSSNWR
jgi:Bacillus/Clostridium GerA spore germination protein